VQSNNLNAALASELPATDRFSTGSGIQLNPCCTLREVGAITIRTTAPTQTLVLLATPGFENRSSTAAVVFCEFSLNGHYNGPGSGETSVPPMIPYKLSGVGQMTVLSRMSVNRGLDRIELGCFDFGGASDVTTRGGQVVIVATGNRSL